MFRIRRISKFIPRRRSIWLAICSVLIAALALSCAAPAAAPTPTPTKAPAAPATPTPEPIKPSPTPAPPTPTPKPDKVSVIVDWFLDGYHAPVLVAKDKGWYAENGLDVEVIEGKGSGDVMRMVASKTQTFGYGDATVIIRAVADEAIPVKVIAGHLVRSAMGMSWLKEKNITKPKDLEGKSMAAVPGSAAQIQWAAFAAANKLDTSKITVITVDPATKDAAMMTGKADFGDDFLGAGATRFTLAGKPGDYLMFTDWGVTFVGHSFIAHKDTLKEKPDIVRRFLAATMKGSQFSKDKPEEAVDIVLKYAPPQRERRGYVVGVLTAANKLLESPNTKGKPLGWLSQFDFQESIDTLIKYGGMKNRPAMDDLYTNDFLPK